jgi:valyl-tRNA synthetase
MQEFPKRFDYREAEPRLYQRWLDAKAFESARAPDGSVRDASRAEAEPFVIVIPPPNITGRLHMGHALNNTVQDVMIRQKRMDGFDALWVPGTDHAGIATQSVVKKQLDAEGINYRDLGREEVIRRIWLWKDKYGDAILSQLRRMGCSCDWSRTRFTMDEGLSHAVKEAFVRLYRENLIYRGKRIVNWCPVDRTALSDDEVEKESEKGKIYHIRYPLQDSPSEHVIVATTRPETMFGDVAVAVNEKDPRWAKYIGKKLVLPLQGRVIPVITDEHADPEVGTGAVKITPAHDPNDFEVGLRHNLEQINVMNEDATMNEIVPERYRGLDRYKARKLALEELEEQGLLAGVHDHEMAIGRSYRSKVPIEYRLSDQWFVKMQPLAQKALQASGYEKDAEGTWTKGQGEVKVEFHPQRFEKVYWYWLSNIRDWCISRQIWWGHRIPAWFHKESGEILVDLDTPERVKAEPEKWRQEDDVLDTWFSSWLWPMSTLGWPEMTPDYQRYYPTTVLSTAKDILFFWVARMNFAGLEFANQLPYRHVYLHSTIADHRGVTMSKSKGNGIDPVTVIDGATTEQLKQPVQDARPSNMKELINEIEKNFPQGFEAVGADAMRWTLVFSITEGENVKLSLARFTEGRNFVTKLWNGAGRILTTLDAELEKSAANAPTADPTDEDRWLLARLDSTIVAVRKGIDEFDFGSIAQSLYRFVWDDYCSWALELSKTRLTSEDTGIRRGALRVMGTVLLDMLRLLHPIMPFVTEELYAKLNKPMTTLGLWLDQAPKSELLVRDIFPKPRNAPNPEIEARFAILQRFVIAARQLRAAYNIKDNIKMRVDVKPVAPETKMMLERATDSVCYLAKLEGIDWADSRKRGMAAQYDPAFELYLDLGKYIDLAVEIDRIDKDVVKSEKERANAEKTLSNPEFTSKAPQERVDATKARLAELSERLTKLAATRAELAEIVGTK